MTEWSIEEIGAQRRDDANAWRRRGKHQQEPFAFVVVDCERPRFLQLIDDEGQLRRRFAGDSGECRDR